jgi:magnesium transporter
VESRDLNFADRIRELLEAGQTEALGELLGDLPPQEIEDSLEDLENEQRKAILDILAPEVAGEVFGGLDDVVQEEVADLLSNEEIAELVEEMDSDEAADTVRLLEPEEQVQVLELLEDETEEELRELLKHEEDTAGDLMMAELAAIHEDALVAEAIEHLRDHQDDIRELYNVYLVDDARRLRGSLSLRDMVLARPGMPMKAFMDPDPVRATPDMDQEEVALLFRKFDLVSLPVVDAEGTLVGRITVDDIMDVMEEEATEDLSRFAGVSELSFRPGRIFRVSRARLPWLLLGLLGGLASGRILQGFEVALTEVLELAFFVPVIMALAGNIGIQSSTIVVRGMATGEIREGETRRLIAREAGVSLINGFVIMIITYLAVWLWLGQPVLATVVAVSMMSVVLWATFTGTFIPIALGRMGQDPAYATGPFVTTTNDIVALAIYLLIAWRLRDFL